MKKIIFGLTVAFAMNASLASAQDTGAEIPSLADVMTNMDGSEIAEMESNIGEAGSLSADFDIAIDVAVESAVAEAIEEGLISASEATDAAAALSIVSDNAQFFNFDILDAIGEVVESGEFTIAEVRSTLEGFNSLSDAGKSVVGQESFDYLASQDNTHPDYTTAKASWDSLSATDQNVVLNQMTLLTECRATPGNPC